MSLATISAAISSRPRPVRTANLPAASGLSEGYAAEIVAKLNFLQNPLVEALTSDHHHSDRYNPKSRTVSTSRPTGTPCRSMSANLDLSQQMADKLVQLGVV